MPVPPRRNRKTLYVQHSLPESQLEDIEEIVNLKNKLFYDDRISIQQNYPKVSQILILFNYIYIFLDNLQFIGQLDNQTII